MGTVEESSAIMALLSQAGDWADSHVVAALAPRLAGKVADPQTIIRKLLKIEGPHNIPEPFLAALHSADRQDQELRASVGAL